MGFGDKFNVMGPTAWGVPLVRAKLKCSPADFQVREQLDFSLDGQGEHLFLRVRKCGLNTQDVIDALQQVFSVQSSDVGIAGLKDRHAITQQWISVRTPLDAATLLPPYTAGITEGKFQIMDAVRHGRKLRRGAHRANKFDLILRDVQLTEAACLDTGITTTATNTLRAANTANTATRTTVLSQLVADRLTQIALQGFPNYFGPQRFGIEQRNLIKARQLFRSRGQRVSRAKRGLYLSAARSAIFNAVCAQRVGVGNWNEPLTGEPMMLAGTRSFFINDSDVANECISNAGTRDRADVAIRCDSLDIHPSGPLWGQGTPVPVEQCLLVESGVVAGFADFCVGLEKAGLKQERRALRALAQNLAWHWIDETTLHLSFELDKGVFATSLLAELMVETGSL